MKMLSLAIVLAITIAANIQTTRASDLESDEAYMVRIYNDYNPDTLSLNFANKEIDDRRAFLISSNNILTSYPLPFHRRIVFEHLDFRNNRFGDIGATNLALSIFVNHDLKSLDIRGNSISPVGFWAVATSVIRAPKFEYLRYSGTPYDDVLLQKVFTYCIYVINDLDGDDHEIVFTKVSTQKDSDSESDEDSDHLEEDYNDW